ncbi:MAG: DUF192 domain-containing protein [Peptococcaceae bacterium]|nr:DUF192 domain-containing protein [Peptococcaceae bacterium]
MGGKSMPAGSALVLSPCGMVHTFFMRFPIDVVFLDPAGRVLRVIHEMPPFRVSPYVKEARTVVELPGGTAKGRVRPGDVLVVYQ